MRGEKSESETLKYLRKQIASLRQENHDLKVKELFNFIICVNQKFIQFRFKNSKCTLCDLRQLITFISGKLIFLHKNNLSIFVMI